ncbi:MAG: DUF1579 family protein [Planctomycetota bacterium]
MRTHWIIKGALALLVFTPLALAQEEMGEAPAGQDMGIPKPAKELARYKALEGCWKGKGTVAPEPGAPAGEWTSVTETKWGYDGHWLVEKTVISMENMPKLMFKTFYGWDAEQHKFVSYGIGNMGGVCKAEIDWLSDGRMLTTNQMIEQGHRVVDSGLCTWGKNECTFVMKRSIDGGDFFVHVKGTMEKVDAVELPAVDNAFPMPTPQPEMKRIAGMVGDYQMEATMIMAPGTPEMKISATEAVSLKFDGSLMLFKSTGDPAPEMGDFVYHGLGAMAWNPNENRYDMIYINNVGEGGLYHGHWLADQKALVMSFAGTYHGQPCVNQGTTYCDDAGKVKGCENYMIIGTHEPYRAFKGTYTPKRQG